jgi:hypothetical protein
LNRFKFVAFIVAFFILISVRSFDPATCTLSRHEMKNVLSTFSIKQAPVVTTTEAPVAQEVADHVMHTASQ